MSSRTASWQASDAWVLLSVVYAAQNGSAPVQQIVHAGDFINHAIFLYEELAGGLDRLLAAGLVEPREGGFAAGAVALSALRSNRRWTVGDDDEVLEALLDAWPPPRRARRRALSPGAFDAAVEAYLHRDR